jgi:hypothetical protein
MPKAAILYYILSLCLLVISCDDDEPQSLIIMTVEVTPDAISNGEQKWICLTDDAGNILDEQELVNGQTVELKSTLLPENVDVTFYSVFPGNYPRHIVSTYKDIPSMKHILIKPGEAGPGISDPLPLGQATYLIHNFPTMWNTESEIYESVNINTGITYYQAHVSTAVVNNTYKAVRNIYKDPTDVLITSFRDGERVYSWAQAKPGEEIVLDLQDFESYNHVLTIPNPGSVLSSTTGRNNDGSSFLLSTTSSSSFQDQLTIGYIDGFDYYFTRLSVWKNDRDFSHVKQGERVESLDFPDYTGTVADASITSFQYSESEPYSWGVGYWHLSDHDFTWTIHGDVNSQLKVNFIPRVIAKNIPGLALSDLKFSRFFLYQRLDGVTFHDHFDQSFGLKEESRFYDFFEVELSN